MKRLLGEAGGRPRANDDLFALQELILTGSGAPLLAALPSCVLSGCAVTPGAGGTYNVAAGLVWLNAGAASGIYDFPGATGTSLPANFALGTPVAIDQRPYQTGGTKTCITDTRAELDPVDDGPGAALYADGPVFWYDHVAARSRTVGDIVMGMYDLNDYDTTTFVGRGRQRGWALCYGQTVNGIQVTDMRGLMPLGYNPDSPSYTQRAVGDTGGAETHTLSVPEMPNHNHSYPMRDDNDNNDDDSGYPETGPDTSDTSRHRTGFTNSSGGNQPHNNMPPFRVLAYRQWIGL